MKLTAITLAIALSASGGAALAAGPHAEHEKQAAKHREHLRHHKAMAQHHAGVMDLVKRIERLNKTAAH